MKTIINETQRGLLFRKGRFVRLLKSGRYFTFGDSRVETVELDSPLFSDACPMDMLLTDPDIAASTTALEVGDSQLALHFVNGQFAECLRSGRYLFWNVHDKHTFLMADISTPEIGADIPTYLFARLPAGLYVKIEVPESKKARLYFDKKLVRLLDAGTYYFWKGPVSVSADFADTRLTRMDITGQEILTLDKVTVRVNFVCTYRITDCIRIATEIDDYAEQLHVAAQLALRDFIGRCRLDELLESKEQLSEFVLERLKAHEQELYVEISEVGVKDIILPGEIRDIMNTVLVAEKQAQANVITRREEVASTRSLLNTAHLMEENQTLYRLKELEYLEHICAHVGSISVNGSGDILSQLAGAIRAAK